MEYLITQSKKVFVHTESSNSSDMVTKEYLALPTKYSIKCPMV